MKNKIGRHLPKTKKGRYLLWQIRFLCVLTKWRRSWGYADLKEQSADFEPVELYAQRMALRSEKSASASNRIQSAYGEKYDPLLMFDSQRDIAKLLQDDAENRVYQQEMEQRKRQEQKEKSRHGDPER